MRKLLALALAVVLFSLILIVKTQNPLLSQATAIICALSPHFSLAQIMRANIGSESCCFVLLMKNLLLLQSNSNHLFEKY